MKKEYLLLWVLIGISFLSCSSDNEDNNLDVDSIIGIWKPIKEIESYIDDSTVSFDYDSCSQMSRFTFNENGTLNIIEFAINENTGNCQEKTNPVLTSGSWKKNSNGKYRLIKNYTETNNQQNYIDDEVPDILEFTNNNNTLKIGYLDNEVINGKQLKNYYTEFVRVQ